MSTVAGWYDAGVPGKLRWWNGSAWTSHEAEVGFGPAPGWYPAPGGVLRWWDGRVWTGLRVKNGVPGTDWATAESPRMAWVLALVWMALALAQFAVALLGSSTWIVAVMFFVVAAMWAAIAITSSAVHRIPAPTGAPETPDAVRPLPGDAEAPGAGWYPVAPRTTRWWTGQQWTEYIGTRFGIRPTFHGARSLRLLRSVFWIMAGGGAVAVGVGIVLWVLAGDAAATILGIAIVGAGVLIVVVGVVMVAVSRTQRSVLLVPEDPPHGAS